MALNRKWIASPCYHGRSMNQVRIIVLHTAEGARTIEDLGHFFANYNNEVSSHVGADDKRGIIGEYVTRGNAAWTQANYNNDAVALELCGFASWSRDTWMNDHHNMLLNCADWIREEATKFGLPINSLTDSQSQGNGHGVTQHIRLGSGGGGHVDCGSGFPMDYVIDLAKGGAITTGVISAEDQVMQLQFDSGDSDHAPACSISIPNEFSGGQHKMRFSAKDTTTLRVDVGEGARDVTVGYLGTQSVDIPKGNRCAIVKRDSGESPVSVAFSER